MQLSSFWRPQNPFHQNQLSCSIVFLLNVLKSLITFGEKDPEATTKIRRLTSYHGKNRSLNLRPISQLGHL